MGWPEKLILVRHAESEGNVISAEERTVFEKSTANYTLTPRGREQAKITGDYIRGRYGIPDVRYTSYYKRAKETMELSLPNQRYYEDPRLREAERGIWHVMTHEQVTAQFPFELERRKRDGLYHYRPWGGENWPDVELRIHSFLGTLARDYEGQSVLMVVHGHWLILFQRLIHHFSIEEALERYKRGTVENASVAVYRNSHGANGSQRLILRQDECCVPWKGEI